MRAAIAATGLTKRYGDTVALDALDLQVAAGEVYGYLGPNGAGKTTTIRLLLGLHRPTAGRAAILGLDAWSDRVAAHRHVAYVAGEPFLWPALTVAVVLALLAGACAWLGAASQGADVALADMLAAGANVLPVVALFLGFGAFAFAVVPRAGPGLAYGAVGATFIWQLLGSVLGVPDWTLGLSPFHQLGLVPAQSFRAPEAAVMVALAAAFAMSAVWRFDRRDLVGA